MGVRATAAALVAAACAMPAVASGTASRHVTVKGFAFAPARMTVARGARVTWTDRDSANHTVTFKHRAGIDNIRTGQSRTLRFTRRGTFTYVCSYHPFMHGRVVVR